MWKRRRRRRGTSAWLACTPTGLLISALTACAGSPASHVFTIHGVLGYGCSPATRVQPGDRVLALAPNGARVGVGGVDQETYAPYSCGYQFTIPNVADGYARY